MLCWGINEWSVTLCPPVGWQVAVEEEVALCQKCGPSRSNSLSQCQVVPLCKLLIVTNNFFDHTPCQEHGETAFFTCEASQ